MRKKSITAFVSIYAALCIAYGIAANGAVINDQEEFVNTEISQELPENSSFSVQQKDSEAKSDNSSSLSASENEENAAISNESEDNNAETIISEMPDSSTEQGENSFSDPDTESSNEEEITQTYDNETQDEVQESIPGFQVEIPQEIIQSEISEEEYQEEIEEEDEIVQDKPTLEEFLRGLRCSGCRHNCSLLSPRCMNGARKVSQAESEYYQTYGA